MSASAIDRTQFNLLADDSGTGTDGSVLDKNKIQVVVLDPLDAMFAAAAGITLNQAGGDGSILALQSSDVAHGMTSIASTDTYGMLAKVSATAGGTQLSGLSSATRGLLLFGGHTTDDTSKSTASNGALVVYGSLKSGTTITALGANANIIAFQNNGTTRQILDGDGDSHQDVGTAWTNFDSFDDVGILTALSVAVSQPGDPLRNGFSQFLELHREPLERARLVTFNEDGHHFVNMSRLSMLLVGAVRQIAADVQRLQEPWYRRVWRRFTGQRLLLPA